MRSSLLVLIGIAGVLGACTSGVHQETRWQGECQFDQPRIVLTSSNAPLSWGESCDDSLPSGMRRLQFADGSFNDGDFGRDDGPGDGGGNVDPSPATDGGDGGGPPL